MLTRPLQAGERDQSGELAVDGVVRSSTAISLDEVIPSWPHALLRVAAGSERRPERS